jgi:hypothetical protein
MLLLLQQRQQQLLLPHSHHPHLRFDKHCNGVTGYSYWWHISELLPCHQL